METKILFRRFKKILDPKLKIILFKNDRITIVFNDQVYRILDNTKYDDYLVDDMYINIDGSLFILLKEDEDE